jgi:hypothetical protein
MPTRPAEALGHEAFLGGTVMHEHHISVPAATDIERLAGAKRHDAHRDPSLPREDWQNMAEEAGLFGAGRAGDRD